MSETTETPICRNPEPHPAHKMGTGTAKDPYVVCDGVEDPTPRYTLDEASRVIADMACARAGHQYNVVTNSVNVPLRVECVGPCKRVGTIDWPGSLGA